ncbi:MAG: hypothetical protein K6343_00670 [Caldisericaceae bacterium]
MGEIFGKGFRIGHMGSVTKDELLVAIYKIGLTFEEFGYKVNLGSALEKFSS